MSGVDLVLRRRSAALRRVPRRPLRQGRLGDRHPDPRAWPASRSDLVRRLAACRRRFPARSAAAYAYWRGATGRLGDRAVVRGVGVPATIVGAYATRWIDGRIAGRRHRVRGRRARCPVPPATRRTPHEHLAHPPTRAAHALIVVVASPWPGSSRGCSPTSGGIVLAPLYIVVLRTPIKAAFACSLVVAAALAVPGTIVRTALLGNIDWGWSRSFGVTSIPLSYVGGARRRCAAHRRRASDRTARWLLAIGLVTLAVRRDAFRSADRA